VDQEEAETTLREVVQTFIESLGETGAVDLVLDILGQEVPGEFEVEEIDSAFYEMFANPRYH
jgi:hypothetical protein